MTMKVSVLSPVRDEELHLDQMIRSLTGQEHADFELIIVDDGSKDDTAAIALAWQDRDPRIRVVSTGVAMGKVRAFNLAFEHATGDLICHLGGDDTATAVGLSARVRALSQYRDARAVAFFKMRIGSQLDPEGAQVLPRGKRGSRSGGSITMTRALAALAFPIPDELPSEDLWLFEVAETLSEEMVESSEIVINVLVHEGNTNPRRKPFEQMSEGIHARMRVWPTLLACSRLDFAEDAQERWRYHWAAEEARYRGDVLRVLTAPGVGLVDRLAMVGMARPSLWWLRRRFDKTLSGWRGR